MLKKEVTFKDLDNNEVSETLYFNLTKIEILELDAELENGIEGEVNALSQLEGADGVVRGKDMLKVLSLFKAILRKAYGVRSDDGRRLIKNTRVWEEFEGSNAFSDLIELFIQDPSQGAEFINAMMPADLLAQAKLGELNQLKAEAATAHTASMATPVPGALEVVSRELTQEELVAMDSDELKSGLATGRYRLPGQSG